MVSIFRHGMGSGLCQAHEYLVTFSRLDHLQASAVLRVGTCEQKVITAEAYADTYPHDHHREQLLQACEVDVTCHPYSASEQHSVRGQALL